jgi:hypothetical protein
MAKSALEALKKEKNHVADECWIDPDWMKDKEFEGNKQAGYETQVCKKKK